MTEPQRLLPIQADIPRAVTAQTLAVTKMAQDYFVQANGDLQRIVANVLDTGSTLSSSAMISDAGRSFGNVAVAAWAERAADISTQFQAMIDFLGQQIQVMINNEQQGVDMANGLANLVLPVPGASLRRTATHST
jgi:hypothetical protein